MIIPLEKTSTEFSNFSFLKPHVSLSHQCSFVLLQVALAGPLSPPDPQLTSPTMPKGSWAQKGEQIVVKSMLDKSSIHINLNDLGIETRSQVMSTKL